MRRLGFASSRQPTKSVFLDIFLNTFTASSAIALSEKAKVTRHPLEAGNNSEL